MCLLLRRFFGADPANPEVVKSARCHCKWGDKVTVTPVAVIIPREDALSGLPVRQNSNEAQGGLHEKLQEEPQEESQEEPHCH